MTNEKRKRAVQVKFRLSPEENFLFRDAVRKSGMSMTEYFLRQTINGLGLAAVSYEREYGRNTMEIHAYVGKQRIGYASVLFFEGEKRGQISSLYVVKHLQDMGIEDALLQEAIQYAKYCKADAIRAYPGAEPYCPTEWKPLEVQQQWYEANGFTHTYDVCGCAPCMEKVLSYED